MNMIRLTFNHLTLVTKAFPIHLSHFAFLKEKTIFCQQSQCDRTSRLEVFAWGLSGSKNVNYAVCVKKRYSSLMSKRPIG